VCFVPGQNYLVESLMRFSFQSKNYHRESYKTIGMYYHYLQSLIFFFKFKSSLIFKKKLCFYQKLLSFHTSFLCCCKFPNNLFCRCKNNIVEYSTLFRPTIFFSLLGVPSGKYLFHYLQSLIFFF
jgi:hypothetical protein